MAAVLPVFLNGDLNRAKNKKASDEVIPFVYETVIAWGCPKDEDESFLAYYNRRPEKLWEDHKEEWEKEVEEKLKTRKMTNWPEASKEKEKKKIMQQLKEEKGKKFFIKETWTRKEEQHLDQETCDGFDATLLYKLVPTICDGIGRYDPNAPSSTKIEQFLKEVKSKWNDICHDPKGASISDTTLDELEESAVNVFKAAGVLYASALEQQTVRDKIGELKERLRKIKEEVMTDEQQRIMQTAKKMSEDGIVEMHAVVKQQDTYFLPLSNDNFVSGPQSPVAMAAALPVLLNRDLNRAKNKKACDEVIPFVYETVIAWGCPKNKDESFLAYYNRRPEKLWEDNKEEWEKEVEEKLKTLDMTNWSDLRKKEVKDKITKQLKQEKENTLLIKGTWTQEDEQHLDQKTCDGLGATFLHKLVPTICDGIGRYDPNAPSITKIEQFLREVKNIRNDICHDPNGASISDTILDDLEVSAVNVFKAAGDLYASTLNQQTAQDKIDELKERLQKIKEEVMILCGTQRIMQTAKKMSEDGMAEMHAAVKQQDTRFLPHSDEKVTRTDAFYSVVLLIKNDNEDDNKDTGTENNKNEKTNREIPSHELLEYFEGSNVLCEGQPGTGKTTLLKTLRDDFLAKTEERFRGVRKFDLLMHMECRNNSITTVEQLLEHHFPKTFQQINREETVEALRELKLLICVDGLDELTSRTNKLLRELISKFGYSGNATFIFTSRPGQARSVPLSHETVTLQPIKGEDQQVEFLRRYQASIKVFKGLALIEAFKSLNETCKAVLRQPVYLALFCALFRKSPQVVKKWKNEVNLLNDFLNLSKQTMIDRMDTMGLADPECYAEDVTAVICDLSVCLLQNKEMTLSANTYSNLCREIFRDHNVEYYSIVSTFFTRHPDQDTFEFYHISHAEFLAAKAIAQRFVRSPAAGVVSTIQAICSERSHYFQDGAATSPAVTDGKDVPLKRFENVLRFVCMLIHEGGPPMQGALQRFLEEVCPALTREEVGLDYWTDLVLSCPDSDQVARAAGEAAKYTWPGWKWTVRSSRAMTATSRMLPYQQPTLLLIEPQRGEDDHAALAVLLGTVTRWHTGNLSLILSESHANYSSCDASLACLDSARCRLDSFKGCLSGRSSPAWRALIGGVKRAKRAGGVTELSISLLVPMRHELGQLDGTSHALCITARPPSSPGDRRRRPLPTNTMRPPSQRVECRPAAGGGAPGDVGEIAALIEDLAPRNMCYYYLHLLHFPGLDGALDEMVAMLRACGVRTKESRTQGWKEAESSSIHDCVACEDSSSHRPRERCVSLLL